MAAAACKELVRAVGKAKINRDLINDTATRIATIRATDEGREGIRAFLEKRKPAWTESPEAPAPKSGAPKRAPKKNK